MILFFTDHNNTQQCLLAFFCCVCVCHAEGDGVWHRTEQRTLFSSSVHQWLHLFTTSALKWWILFLLYNLSLFLYPFQFTHAKTVIYATCVTFQEKKTRCISVCRIPTCWLVRYSSCTQLTSCASRCSDITFPRETEILFPWDTDFSHKITKFCFLRVSTHKYAPGALKNIEFNVPCHRNHLNFISFVQVWSWISTSLNLNHRDEGVTVKRI